MTMTMTMMMITNDDHEDDDDDRDDVIITTPIMTSMSMTIANLRLCSPSLAFYRPSWVCPKEDVQGFT